MLEGLLVNKTVLPLMLGTSIVDIKVQYIQSPLVTECTIRCVRFWYLRSNVGTVGMYAAARVCCHKNYDEC
jgi:hypothetical protein